MKYYHFRAITREELRELGRQGGVSGGKDRRDRVLEQFVRDVEVMGLERAAIRFRHRSWVSGYYARVRFEERTGMRSVRRAAQDFPGVDPQAGGAVVSGVRAQAPEAPARRPEDAAVAVAESVLGARRRD